MELHKQFDFKSFQYLLVLLCMASLTVLVYPHSNLQCLWHHLPNSENKHNKVCLTCICIRIFERWLADKGWQCDSDKFGLIIETPE